MDCLIIRKNDMYKIMLPKDNIMTGTVNYNKSWMSFSRLLKFSNCKLWNIVFSNNETWYKDTYWSLYLSCLSCSWNILFWVYANYDTIDLFYFSRKWTFLHLHKYVLQDNVWTLWMTPCANWMWIVVFWFRFSGTSIHFMRWIHSHPTCSHLKMP